MPATNPRISTVVGPDVANWLHRRSEQEGRSLSELVREILTGFYKEEEEHFWAAAGEDRLASFDREKALSHQDVWGED